MEWLVSHTGLCACLLMLCPVVAQAGLISEILYDAIGIDSGKVFVELFGAPGTDLSGWSLQGVNGGNRAAYKAVLLSGVIPADGVFVIAGRRSGGGTHVSNADLILSVDFQNGPDSMLLLDGSSVIDAIAYGSFTGQIFAGEGMAAPDPPAGSGLARSHPASDTKNNAFDFEELAVPTPGSLPGVPVVLPAFVYLLNSGLSVLLLRRCNALSA